MRIRYTIAVLLAVAVSPMAFSYPTSMDNTDRFTWSTVAGWMNWEPVDGSEGCYIDEVNTRLTGHIWVEGIGWISLDPDGVVGGTGVTYTSLAGTAYCSGFAWSPVAGWINFDPGDGMGAAQVTIDQTAPNPAFEGEAWGEGIGWIVMEGLNFGPRTDGTIPVQDWMLYAE